jgi:hypothetical protein
VRNEKEVHNNDTLQMLRDRQGEQTEEVWRAWDFLYRDQQRANQWPQEVGKDFLAMIEFLKWGDTIPDTQRYEYAMFIKTCLPRLKWDLKMRMSQQQWDDLQREIKGRPTGVTVAKKASAKKAATSKGSSDAAADASKTPAEQSQLDELVGLVVWDDYNRLLEHFPWGASPTPLEIWLAQEDLWVYKALLQIIMETNSGASSHSSAPVKRIVTMEIAQYAAQALVSSQSRYGGMGGPMGSGGYPGSGGSMGSGYPGSGGSMGSGYPGPSGPMGSGYPGPSGPMGSGPPGGSMPRSVSGSPSSGSSSSSGEAQTSGSTAGMSGPSSSMGMSGPSSSMGMSGYSSSMGMMTGMRPEDRLRGRYVDLKGQPDTRELTQLLATEFKLMPVRMVLVIDHRRLPKLLVNCANSTMPVEVRTVSISSAGGGQGLNVPSMGGSSGMGTSESGRMPMGRPMGSPMGSGSPYPGSTSGASSPYPGPSGSASSSYSGSTSGASSPYPGPSGGARSPYPGPSGGARSPYPGATAKSSAGGAMGSSGGGMPTSQFSDVGPYDVTVEIQGIIFIFNAPPADRGRLASSSAAETPAGDRTAATPGAATPAAPAAGAPAAGGPGGTAPSTGPAAAGPGGTAAPPPSPPEAAPGGTAAPPPAPPEAAPGKTAAADAPGATPAEKTTSPGS